jgi:hypothetical protein
VCFLCRCQLFDASGMGWAGVVPGLVRVGWFLWLMGVAAGFRSGCRIVAMDFLFFVVLFLLLSWFSGVVGVS